MKNFDRQNKFQNGNVLFIVLIAVALFAALGYALSRGGDAPAALSSEKARLLASDVMDMGNGYANAVTKLRLRKVSDTKISFENAVMTGYTNASCTDTSCKIFEYDGGGQAWEKPTTDINGGEDWSFTGDIAISNIGTASADLVALLPNLSLTLCNRINTLMSLYDSSGTPPAFSGVAAGKFTGTYAVTPTTLSNTIIQGQKSGCVKLNSFSGTAFSASVTTPTYVYYHVLNAR